MDYCIEELVADEETFCGVEVCRIHALGGFYELGIGEDGRADAGDHRRLGGGQRRRLAAGKSQRDMMCLLELRRAQDGRRVEVPKISEIPI